MGPRRKSCGFSPTFGGLDDLEADHVGERHDEVGARSPADVLLAAEYPELLDDGPLLKSKG